ncbi:hypothetical protein D6829_02330 [Candidatus Pacearchaeota archaeon]|nr:MAG: hypothetical protein D6829_02330 [Candidatus Pacearchaeota archaeon]
MVKKKKSKKKSVAKKTRKSVGRKKISRKVEGKKDTLKIAGDREIAYDFAVKVYDKFDQMIKSIIHFGSTARKDSKSSSDIDIIIVIDDVSILWDEELIAWYREELRKLAEKNVYTKPLHLNTVKLSTWWRDLLRGDPVIVNVIRYGEPLVDFGGFFTPLKVLLRDGKIKSTPEAIYSLIERAPHHMARSRQALMSAVDGIYWSMVDAAHAALIASDITPPSPELIPEILIKAFVNGRRLDKKYVYYYDEVHTLAKDIVHGKKVAVHGKDIDELFDKADEFLKEMSRIVRESIEEKEANLKN